MIAVDVGGPESQPSPAPTQVTPAAQPWATFRSQGSSPSTARPSGGRAASSSALAWAICRRLPKPPRWASPTRVITPTLRRGQLGQRGDLARPAGAQFQHGVVVVRLDGRHAQGHAEVVVEVSRAGRAAKPRLQHGVDHLPRGGLAGAAGHGDHRAGELAPLPPRPGQQCPMRVVDADGPAVVGHGNVLGHHGAGRAARNASPTNCSPSWFGPRSAQNTSPGSIFRLSLATGPSGAVGQVAERVAPTQPAADHVVEFAEGGHRKTGSMD